MGFCLYLHHETIYFRHYEGSDNFKVLETTNSTKTYQQTYRKLQDAMPITL